MNDPYIKKMFITKKYLEIEIQKQVAEDTKKNKEDISHCFKRLAFVNRQLAYILNKSQHVFKEKQQL